MKKKLKRVNEHENGCYTAQLESISRAIGVRVV